MVVSPAPPVANSKHRESKEALAELKTKLEFALSRLNDQDTQRTGIEEIREFLQTLYPDWFPMVITCIGEAGTNLKPLGRCESVKLLGLLAELHGDAVIPLLQRMLQVVLTRLQDADLHLREACAETVFRLTRSLVVDADGSPVFATLLKPLFAALTEHNKWVQIGAASCICAVIQGSPPAVLSENLQRLSSRLVQHLSLPLAMARPQLLSACIHVMQAVSLSEFDDILPSLMPCLEICLNSTADWQTRKQAVEVLQALGDQLELGQSLQIPPLVDPSARPTPFQKKLSAMMDGLREDKVRAVREAAKDVLVRWCVTAKAAPSSVSVGSGGEKAERPLRPSSPCAAQFAAEREAPSQGNQRASLTLPGRSTSPGPASWDRDQARLSESGGGRARNVRPPPRERDPGQTLEEERPFDRLDERRCSDAAAEKAARNIAVKNALSNADLSSTKKPRPKRERVSIFNQPANSSFFQSATQNPSGAGDVEDVVVMPSPQEDRLLSSGGSAEIERAGGIHALEQNEASPASLQENACKAAERSEEEEGTEGNASLADVSPAKAHGKEHLGGVEVDVGGFGEEDMAPQASRFPRRLSQGEARAKRQARDARKPIRPQQKKIEVEASIDIPDSQQSGGKPESEDFPGPRDEPPSPLQMAVGNSGRTSSKESGEELQDEKYSAMAAETGSASPAPASWTWEEPHRPEPFTSPSMSPQRLTAADEEMEALLAQMNSLTQRVLSLEEEKHRSERRMTERLQQLARTCEGQGELIAAQQRRLEAQEQQMQMLEERVAQQDDELAHMDQQLQEQQLQLQQQDQRLEQDDQQLNEHQQQLEQQEQELEKHSALFVEALANHSASSASSVRQKAWAEEDAKERSETPTGPAERWAAPEGWTEGAEAPRAPNPLPAANAAIIGAGGALAGSSSERPLALPGRAKVDTAAAKPSANPKPGGHMWDSVVELCAERRFLEAYKQVIAEPEETCLLRLMKHTGPIVDRLDAESNSRLIRRLIHILSSPSKEPAAASIEQIFSWLWQALNQGIHFTASQVEDLVSALQKVSSAQSPLSGPEKAEATQLLQQVSTHRRS